MQIAYKQQNATVVTRPWDANVSGNIASFNPQPMSSRNIPVGDNEEGSNPTLFDPAPFAVDSPARNIPMGDNPYGTNDATFEPSVSVKSPVIPAGNNQDGNTQALFYPSTMI